MTQANSNNLVVDDFLDTSVLPSNSAGMMRDVTLRDGFKIDGAIYAHHLTASGNGSVSGPIVVAGEATIAPPEPWQEGRAMIFLSGISAGVSLTTHVPDTKQSSPVAMADHIPLIIRGDILAPIVSLENAVVAGNIYCDDAVITDSIILGRISVKNALRLENSVVLSYKAGSVNIRGRNTLLLPYGQSTSSLPFFAEAVPAQNPTHFEDAERGQPDDATQSWVRYMALCYSEGCGKEPDNFEDNVQISCPRHLQGSCPYTDVRLNSSDVLGTDDDGYILTVAPRLLNVETIEDNIQMITEFLADAYMYEHFDSSTRESFLKRSTDLVDPIQRLLYNILKPTFDLQSPSA